MKSVPPCDSSGHILERAINWVLKLSEAFGLRLDTAGQIQQSSRCYRPSDSLTNPLEIWFTDPPYYDAIPYADLSDFFFVWLKRALPGHPLLRDPFDADNALSPKSREAVQCEKVKDVNGSCTQG